MVPENRGAWLRATMSLAGALVVASCAQQEIPPGGPEDRRPPVVVRTVPEPLGVLDAPNAPVTFYFDERISERVAGGTLATAFVVSPRSGELRVSKGGRSIEVRPDGGFRSGLVYRVTLQAVVSDLFGNQMVDPFELVFTTGGGEPVATTLAGEVWDRVSGRAVADAMVLAESDDGLVHQARSDRRGIFAFRYLPVGDFRVTAFEDRNRNGDVDSMEVQGFTSAGLATGDTVLVDVAILQPDTSAAVVTDAEALDSITVVVTFDDYVSPEADPQDWDVRLTVSDTTPAAVGAATPGVATVFTEAAYARHVEVVADSFARLDSLEAAAAAAEAAEAARVAAAAGVDTTGAGADTAVSRAVEEPPQDDPPPDTVVVGAVDEQEPPPGRVPPVELRPLQGERPGPTPDGRRVLPARRIVVVLDEPVTFDVVYAVSVVGVVNLVGLGGGGGEADFLLESPPPPEPTVPDTGAAPDTGSVPDSTTVPDTGRVFDPDAPLGIGGVFGRRR